MAIDLSRLDAKIERLTRLREMLLDDDWVALLSAPDTIAMIQQACKGNGARKMIVGLALAQARENNGENAPSEGSFRNKVLGIANEHIGTFDARFVRGKLVDGNHRFVANDPMIAINTALRALESKGLIRLVEKGSGRKPNTYEVTREGGTT
jgi:hypothetical protein